MQRSLIVKPYSSNQSTLTPHTSQFCLINTDWWDEDAYSDYSMSLTYCAGEIVKKLWSFQTGGCSHDVHSTKVPIVSWRWNKWSFQTGWSFQRSSFHTDFTYYIEESGMSNFQCLSLITQRHFINDYRKFLSSGIFRDHIFCINTRFHSIFHVYHRFHNIHALQNTGRAWKMAIPGTAHCLQLEDVVLYEADPGVFIMYCIQPMKGLTSLQ